MSKWQLNIEKMIWYQPELWSDSLGFLFSLLQQIFSRPSICRRISIPNCEINDFGSRIGVGNLYEIF